MIDFRVKTGLVEGCSFLPVLSTLTGYMFEFPPTLFTCGHIRKRRQGKTVTSSECLDNYTAKQKQKNLFLTYLVWGYQVCF